MSMSYLHWRNQRNLIFSVNVREPVKKKKKKNVENSTFGGGPDPGIFHISKKKKKSGV